MKAKSCKWMVLLGAMLIWTMVAVGQTPTGHSRLGYEHQPAAGAAAETVTLEQLVREAEQNNPAIAASGHNVEAKRALVQPARTLPDPTLGFQHMGDIIPLQLQEGDPSSARTYSVQQEVPFPGKITLDNKGQFIQH